MTQKHFHSTAVVETPIVWKSADGREWKAHEMESTHILNICRQIVNQFADRLGLDQIEIQTPKARINFYAMSWSDGLSYLGLFMQELFRREDDSLSSGYSLIWRELKQLLGLIVKVRAERSEWFESQFNWNESIWTRGDYE